MEDEERTEASDADAVDVVIADKLLAVGDLIQALRIPDLKDCVPVGVTKNPATTHCSGVFIFGANIWQTYLRIH